MTYFYRLVKHQFDDLRSVNEIARSKKLMSGYKQTTSRLHDFSPCHLVSYYTITIHVFYILINLRCKEPNFNQSPTVHNYTMISV